MKLHIGKKGKRDEIKTFKNKLQDKKEDDIRSFVTHQEWNVSTSFGFWFEQIKLRTIV